MRHIFLMTLALAVTACVTTKPYVHNTLTDPAQIERQRAIDDGYCAQVASGVQVPQIVTQPTGGGTYQVNGTVSTYGQNGTTNSSYTGTVQKNDPNSFSKGFANGQNIANAVKAGKDKEAVRHGCMVERGWSAQAN